MIRIVTYQDKHYKLTEDGTYYDARAEDSVIGMLDTLRKLRTVVILSYGDKKDGRQWLEENDITGRVGRSWGPVKMPLIVKNGSIGGSHILDHCLVRIRNKKTGGVIWQHKTWYLPTFHWRLTEEVNTAKYLPLEVLAYGNVVARFRDLKTAKQWCHVIGTSLVVPAGYGQGVKS